MFARLAGLGSAELLRSHAGVDHAARGRSVVGRSVSRETCRASTSIAGNHLVAARAIVLIRSFGTVVYRPVKGNREIVRTVRAKCRQSALAPSVTYGRLSEIHIPKYLILQYLNDEHRRVAAAVVATGQYDGYSYNTLFRTVLRGVGC